MDYSTLIINRLLPLETNFIVVGDCRVICTILRRFGRERKQGLVGEGRVCVPKVCGCNHTGGELATKGNFVFDELLGVNLTSQISCELENARIVFKVFTIAISNLHLVSTNVRSIIHDWFIPSQGNRWPLDHVLQVGWRLWRFEVAILVKEHNTKELNDIVVCFVFGARANPFLVDPRLPGTQAHELVSVGVPLIANFFIVSVLASNRQCFPFLCGQSNLLDFDVDFGDLEPVIIY